MVVDLALLSSSSLMLPSEASFSIKGGGGKRKRDWLRGHSMEQTAALSSHSASPLTSGQHSHTES